jgi:hypothetical protein
VETRAAAQAGTRATVSKSSAPSRPPEVPVRHRPLLALPVLALSLLVVPAAGADQSATAVAPFVQTYDGAFKAPTRFTNTESGFPGAGRRVYLAAQAADGIIADIFRVDPRVLGGTFVIDNVADATGEGEVDVYFYSEFGDIQDGNTAITTGQFDTPAKGETGFVPAGTVFALVFSPNAINPTFTFTATQRPEVALTALDGVTVPIGTTLGITNDTADYATITHVPSSTRQKQLIDRSGTGNGLRVDETVDITFPSSTSAAGTYVFETSEGTKTVTVTK